MVTEKLNKTLIEMTNKAKESGISVFEITDEDGEAEVYFIDGNTGMGNFINEINDDIRNVENKDASEIKKICSAKKTKINWYENCGEWVVKIRVEL